MKIAVMQPYMFPYIGYFQLINAVDKFIFYDDVNFIKKGWINRNKILIGGKENLFSIPLKEASQNKLINQIKTDLDDKWIEKFYKTLEYSYKKAPYFQETILLCEEVFKNKNASIAELTIASIKAVSNYLEINTIFEISSQKYAETKGLEKADRLIKICKLNNATEYYNPGGGKEIYNKEYFDKFRVGLSFLECEIKPYKQFSKNFVPGLSIIDVLMFNSKEGMKKMLNQYHLV